MCAIYCIAKLHIEGSGENLTFQIIFFDIWVHSKSYAPKSLVGWVCFELMGLVTNRLGVKYFPFVLIEDDIKELDLAVIRLNPEYVSFFFPFLHFLSLLDQVRRRS